MAKHLIQTLPDLKKTIVELCKHERLSHDTETKGPSGIGGLFPFHGSRSFSHIFATKSDEYYIDFNVGGINQKYKNLLQPIFDDEQRIIFYCNAIFDGCISHFDGLKFKNRIVDGPSIARVEFSLHDGGRYAKDGAFLSLEYLCNYYEVQAKNDLVKQYVKENNLYYDERCKITGKLIPRYDLVPIDLMFNYGCDDARSTFDVCTTIIKCINHKDVTSGHDMPMMAVVQNEIKFTSVLLQMKIDGAKIDSEYVERATKHENEKALRLKKEVDNLTGGINLNSGKQIAEYLITRGVDVPKKPPTANALAMIEKWLEKRKVLEQMLVDLTTTTKTKTPKFLKQVESITKKLEICSEKIDTYKQGNYVTDKKTLQKIMGKYPNLDFLTKVSEIKQAEKKVSTYYSNFAALKDANDIIHCNFNQEVAITGRLSSSNPNLQNCLSMDTEILTSGGWKTFKDIDKNEEIYSYNINSRTLEKEKITEIIYNKGPQKAFNFKKTHLDICVTEGHNMLFFDRKSKITLVKKSEHYLKDAQILNSSIYDSSKNLFNSCAQIQLLVAFQADGYFSSTKRQIIFSFHKSRKVERLENILTSLNLPFMRVDTNKNNYRKVRITLSKPAWVHSKFFSYDLLNMSLIERKVFLHELRYWDGLYTREPLHYTTKEKINADVVQAISAITDKRSKLSCLINNQGNKYNHIFNTNRNYTGTANTIQTSLSLDNSWCVRVPNGFILTRRNGCTAIVGNCHKEKWDGTTEQFLIRKSVIPKHPDYNLFFFDYKGQEMYIMVDLSEDMQVIKDIIENETDIYIAMVNIVYEVSGIKITRDQAKALSLGVAYGQGKALIAKNLRCSMSEAQELKEAFLKGLKGVAMLNRRMMKNAERNRKIVNPFGRVSYILDRNLAYKALNSLIQGSAADVTKTAMVALHEYLKPYKSHMILTVHDEIIVEIHKDEHFLIDKIKVIMSDAYPHKHLRLKVDVEYSKKSWGEKEGYNE